MELFWEECIVFVKDDDDVGFVFEFKLDIEVIDNILVKVLFSFV